MGQRQFKPKNEDELPESAIYNAGVKYMNNPPPDDAKDLKKLSTSSSSRQLVSRFKKIQDANLRHRQDMLNMTLNFIRTSSDDENIQLEILEQILKNLGVTPPQMNAALKGKLDGLLSLAAKKIYGKEDFLKRKIQIQKEPARTKDKIVKKFLNTVLDYRGTIATGITYVIPEGYTSQLLTFYSGTWWCTGVKNWDIDLGTLRKISTCIAVMAYHLYYNGGWLKDSSNSIIGVMYNAGITKVTNSAEALVAATSFVNTHMVYVVSHNKMVESLVKFTQPMIDILNQGGEYVVSAYEYSFYLMEQAYITAQPVVNLLTSLRNLVGDNVETLNSMSIVLDKVAYIAGAGTYSKEAIDKLMAEKKRLENQIMALGDIIEEEGLFLPMGMEGGGDGLLAIGGGLDALQLP